MRRDGAAGRQSDGTWKCGQEIGTNVVSQLPRNQKHFTADTSCCEHVAAQCLRSTHGREVKVSKDVLLLGGEHAGAVWGGEDGLEAGELLVKVTDVLLRPDDRQEGGLQLLGQQSAPVHPLSKNTQSADSNHQHLHSCSL